MMMPPPHRRTVPVLALLTAAALLAGCASADPAQDADDVAAAAGVAHGASKEEYLAAFEDVEEITLITQLGGAEGSISNVSKEAYMDAVTEWSGGRITFEVAYGNGIVMDPTEGDNALADGRLDLNFAVGAGFEPDVYPYNRLLSDAGFLTAYGPSGATALTGFMMQVMADNDVFYQEWEDAGVHILAPTHNGILSAIFILACSDDYANSAAGISGRIAAVGSAANQAQAGGLGLTPVTLPWTEVYEGLQRGVVDCYVTPLSAIQSASLDPLIPFASADTDVAFANIPTALAFGKDRWDELPLVARQLLFDRMDVLFTTAWTEDFGGAGEMLAKLESHGGGLVPFEADARAALRAANEKLLADMAARGLDGVDVDRFVEIADEWQDRIAEYGLPQGDLAEYLRGTAPTPADFDAILDALFTEFLADRRPAA
ncbi:TRAP transporter substrate-binding protein [Microbacterium sp. No. 7]|uniref:TRAP transporter substrate-binding protein n=1 Tax=Microbacterium sp. No. 7 TaxID=1714373 RepID=UPI0006D06786|nr:hypothetical protein [Microbacterium sp. No. 7]ALJ18872.1 hypothetical protein AOA12_02675 [Microbacterium sp. No. 7]